MLKNALRNTYKAKRKRLSPFFISQNSLTIANQLLQLDIWQASYFHIFLSIRSRNEVDTDPIITLLQAKDKNIVIPKVSGERALQNLLLTDSTLFKENSWNIPEPVEGIAVPESKIDVVFVPLLAFDEQGNRVGYGKGFYDTFLQKCRLTTVKIGLSFFEAEKQIHNVAETDIRLDYCVTPNMIYEF